MRLADVEIMDEKAVGRGTWTFQYSTREVSRAASALAAHHREREAFYTTQAEELEQQLRETGVQLREQSMTGGPRMTAVVDVQLSEQVSAARTKRDGHRLAAEEFDAYAAALAHDSAHTMTLTIDDVRYFGLVGEAWSGRPVESEPKVPGVDQDIRDFVDGRPTRTRGS